MSSELNSTCDDFITTFSFLILQVSNEASTHNPPPCRHLGSCQNRLAAVPNDTTVSGTNDDTVAVRTQRGTNVAFRPRCGNKQHILHPFPARAGRSANSIILSFGGLWTVVVHCGRSRTGTVPNLSQQAWCVKPHKLSLSERLFAKSQHPLS